MSMPTEKRLLSLEMKKMSDECKALLKTIADWGITPQQVDLAKRLPELRSVLTSLMESADILQEDLDGYLARALPTVTGNDVGDALSVVDGAWTKTVVE